MVVVVLWSWSWWLWWLWFGRCVCHACLSIRNNARASNKNAPVPSAPAPSAGLTSRAKSLRLFPPKAGSRRPQSKPHTKAMKKIARLAHLTLLSFGGRGAQSFPSPRRWMPRIRSEMRNNTWTCLSGKPDPLPTELPASGR